MYCDLLTKIYFRFVNTGISTVYMKAVCSIYKKNMDWFLQVGTKVGKYRQNLYCMGTFELMKIALVNICDFWIKL